MSQGPHKDTDSCEPISDHCRTTPQNRLKLPTTEEDWLAADLFFASNTVPKVCCESSVDVANLLLVDDIYHYFQNTFGTTSNARCKRKQTPAASRRLSRLQQQKRAAQRSLRHAKKKKISRQKIFPLVKTWRNLIRVHNKTKRHMQRKSFKKQSRIQQKQLSTSFWKFAKSILQTKYDDVEPNFSEDCAFNTSNQPTRLNLGFTRNFLVLNGFHLYLNHQFHCAFPDSPWLKLETRSTKAALTPALRP